MGGSLFGYHDPPKWSTFRLANTDGSVLARDIAAGAVAAARIANDAVTTAKIVAGAITNSRLAVNAVTSDKIADGSVLNRDISENVISSSRIRDNTLLNRDIQADVITSSRIRNGTIQDADISGSAAISDSKISYDTTKTGRLAIPPAAFTVNDTATINNRGNYVYGEGSGTAGFVAPVNFPNGVIVTNMRFQFYDDHVEDTEIWLYRTSSDGDPETDRVTLGNISSSTTGTASSWQTLNDSSINFETVDNDKYTYWLYGYVNGTAGTDVKAGAMTITYEYTSLGY